MIRNGLGPVLLLLVGAVLALALGETLLARGMKQAGDEGRWFEQAIRAIRNPWVWSGAGLLVLHLLFYMAALARADLSLVLTLTAASYPLTVLLAQVLLDERVGTARWVGTALITIGIAVVGFGESLARR